MSDYTSTLTFKADISNLKASMQEAARQIKLANSEFKAATAGMDDWADSADGLQAKITQLDKVLQSQERQLEALETQYKEVADAEGEDSKGAEDLMIRINNQKAAIIKTQSELTKYEAKLDDVENGSEDLGKATDDVTESTKDAGDGFTVMKGVLADLAATAIKEVLNGLKEIASYAVEVGMSFDSSMAKVAALSGATGDELNALKEKAQEMGETTMFSASESADAFGYMALAGWDTAEMLEGIEPVLSLAAAANMDLAEASDIVTDYLTAFGLEAKDAAKFTDQMAYAMANSNTDVTQLGEAYKNVAATAASMGYSVEDTTAVLMTMANAGVKGGEAGTALSAIMTRLATDTKSCASELAQYGVEIYDSEGSMNDLASILDGVRGVWEDLTDEEQANLAKMIAGTSHYSDFATIMQGLASETDDSKSSFEAYQEALENCDGAATDMADTMQDTVAGSLTILKSNVEGKMIRVFEQAKSSIRRAVERIGDALDGLDWDEIADGVGNFAAKVADLISYLVSHERTVISLLKTTAGLMTAVFAINKVSNFTKSIQTVAPAIQSFLTNPIGLAVAAVAGLTAATVAYMSAQKAAIEDTYGLTAAEEDLIDAIEDMTGAYEDSEKARKDAMDSVSAEWSYVEELKEEYNSLLDSNGQVVEGYEDRANFILTTLSDALGIELDALAEEIEANGELGASIDELIQKRKAEAMLAANEAAYTEALQNRTEAFENMVEAEEMVSEAEQRLAEVTGENGNALEAYQAMLAYAPDYAAQYYQANQTQIEACRAAQAAYDEASAALEDAQATYEGYNATIANYEGFSAAIISGETEKIEKALLKMQNGFLTAESSDRASLERQVSDFEAKLSAMQKAVDRGAPGVTQAMVDEMATMVALAKNELANLPAEASSSGYYMGEGFAAGMGSATSIVYQKAWELGKKALAALKAAGQEGSPWKTTIQSGEWFGEGFSIGIQDTVKDVVKQAANLAESAYTSLGDVDLTDAGKKSGRSFLSGLASATSVGVGVSSPVTATSGSTAAGTTGAGTTQTIVFNQTNNSPKALDSVAIYKATNDSLFAAKWRLNNV